MLQESPDLEMFGVYPPASLRGCFQLASHKLTLYLGASKGKSLLRMTSHDLVEHESSRGLGYMYIYICIYVYIYIYVHLLFYHIYIYYMGIFNLRIDTYLNRKVLCMVSTH